MAEHRLLTETHLDVLKEIGNIGLGNAATALATMVNKRIDMAVPRSRFLSLEEVMELIGGLEEIVCCVSLRLEGDVPGQILFIFNLESTFNLVDMLMGMDKGTTRELDEMGESVVKEIGNVLTGSFLSAIGTMTGLTMIPTVPMFATDMLGAVLSTSLVAGGYVEDHILTIETLLFEDQEEIKGHFFLFTDQNSLQTLFNSLGLTL
ncbi:chemotaxis protein CheC [Desulforamulus hydrothermalis]|uniref:CheC, inhibitor of MCP methylation n=1 Tax=Desulforamulus hydrothermalis Lam5 = DSM 18033 TaxID=1121428 RepID=K8E0P2_9FIRM|nr:chemotaxis protein CheC [Desulforamulus hydrothermalis]CCO09189.1 CheC, inhibitor of MCP methylation [Desulforamulus hydrothermalis Lam5 = DSM 18033]SHH11009.1 chemotaxis protein CheC [Desulforamulus hydrothermalis Lam5 = DSM 18033]